MYRLDVLAIDQIAKIYFLNQIIKNIVFKHVDRKTMPMIYNP